MLAAALLVRAPLASPAARAEDLRPAARIARAAARKDASGFQIERLLKAVEEDGG